RDVGAHRADRLHARKRLADDPGEERRRRPVRPARPHGDRHEPRGAAVDVALARVIGDEVLADELLRAVRGLRRGQRRVARVRPPRGPCARSARARRAPTKPPTPVMRTFIEAPWWTKERSCRGAAALARPPRRYPGGIFADAGIEQSRDAQAPVAALHVLDGAPTRQLRAARRDRLDDGPVLGPHLLGEIGAPRLVA